MQRSLDTRPFTRRQLLKGGALALAGLGAAELAACSRPAGPRTAAAAAAPARCVTLGANGVINPWSSQDYASCRDFLLETRTNWVRIWADWPSLQPEANLAPDQGSGAWRVRELDRQIGQANADGVRVILTAYRFPAWANGSHEPFTLPSDLGLGGAWASWIEFLAKRYGAAIAALEIVNEPNFQLRPVEGVHRAVAQMFQTAQAVASGTLLLGPATSDTPGSPAFTRLLLDELDRIGFEPGTGFAWSHHNYTDVEHDEVSGVLATQQLLKGRWAGWPNADASRPVILIPEGGARLTKIAKLYGTSDPAQIRALQARLIHRNWQRMANRPGIAMLGQYLFYSDPNFDCGLCEIDGTRRPAFATWAGLPSSSSALGGAASGGGSSSTRP